MIDPYKAVGLIPTMRGIRHRDEIGRNIDHIAHLIKAASWLTGLDLPVKLIAIPEGALQGFNDEVLDLDHEEFARECAISIPGPETDRLGELARQWDAYLIAQAKARHPEFPNRYFNIGFIIDPDGEIILKHYKTVAAAAGRALGHPARRVGLVGRAVRRRPSTRSSRSPTPRSAASASSWRTRPPTRRTRAASP